MIRSVKTPSDARTADVAVIFINRDTPDLVDRGVDSIFAQDYEGEVDIYVVEMGSTHKSQFMTFYYEDEPYSGKPLGHLTGLDLAHMWGTYRYYLIMHNDVFFEYSDALSNLVDLMDNNPELGLLSPTGDHGFLEARPQAGRNFHLVASVDYLGFIIRAEIFEKIGFLDPAFRYSWGANLEFCFKIHQAGYRVAYCDIVQQIHYGTSTWGVVAGLPSRKEYIERAKAFPVGYYNDKYGYDWDDQFSVPLPGDVNYNVYRLHRANWQGLGGDKPKLLRVWLGNENREGWLNVWHEWRPFIDAVYPLDEIRMLRKGTVDLIEVESPAMIDYVPELWRILLKPSGTVRIGGRDV